MSRSLKCSVLISAIVLLVNSAFGQTDRERPEWQKYLNDLSNKSFLEPEMVKAKTDSLLQIALKSNDAEKTAHYTEVLALIAFFQNDSTNAAQGFAKAESYFHSKEDFISLGDYNFRKGYVMLNKLKFDEAEIHFKDALSFFAKINDLKRQTIVLYKLSVLYGFDNRLGDVVSAATKGLKLAEQSGNRKQQWEGNLLLGQALVDFGQQGKGMDYFLRSAEIALSIKDTGSYALSAFYMADYLWNQKDVKKALDYARTSYNYFITHPRPELNSLNCLLGNLHFANGSLDSASMFALKFLEAEGALQNKTAIVEAHNMLGRIAFAKKNYAEAKQHYEISLPLLKELGTTQSCAMTYKGLAEVAFKLNQPAKAYEYLLNYVSMHDSVYRADSQAQIAQTEAQFQNEKKQLEIENLNKDKALKDQEIKKQSMRNVAMGAGLLLTLVFAIIIYNSYRKKQKANLTIKAQRDQMEQQKTVVEQKNKEILDSINYARRIQRSLMPSDQYIDRNIKRMKKS